jgi:hypothetical protein
MPSERAPTPFNFSASAADPNDANDRNFLIEIGVANSVATARRGCHQAAVAAPASDRFAVIHESVTRHRPRCAAS